MSEHENGQSSPASPATIIEGILELSAPSSERIGHHTVIKGEGYRVVILSFPKGYVLKEHKTPKTLLIQALDGRFRFNTLGADHIAEPGKLIQLAPDVPHEVEALEAGHLQLTLLDT